MSSPILVTMFGMDIDFKPVQMLNAKVHDFGNTVRNGYGGDATMVR